MSQFDQLSLPTHTHLGLCRSHLVAKLIFLDQICEISPHIPRSTLESHVPYTILRSIYSQCYSNSSTPFAQISGSSPRHSPAMSLAHGSPSLRQPRGDSSTPLSNTLDSGYPKPSSTHGQDQYEMDSFGTRSIDSRNRNVRRSGPLDYSQSHKPKFAGGSTSTSTGPSPLPRFAVSRSGPISYK